MLFLLAWGANMTSTPTNRTSQTLAEHLRINDADIALRKSLLGLTPALEIHLCGFEAAARESVDAIVEDFYLQQTEIPQIQNIIGDSDTLGRLKGAMRGYITSLFGGNYGADYVNSRLRIGKVHARIGVPPKMYVSSMHRLETHIEAVLSEGYGYDPACEALSKLMLFDLQLVFDTYIQGLVSEVELARDEVIKYSESLEQKVLDRTREIERLAQTDDLTGLCNRRHFLARATDELAATQQRGGVVSLVFLDLDGFKHVNDAIGHQEGDRVLTCVGQSIADSLSGPEIAARYGGDEFCVLLPKVDADGAQIFCQNLAQGFMHLNCDRLSASFGIATAGPDSYPSLDELFAIADGAMYATRQDVGDEPPTPFLRRADG